MIPNKPGRPRKSEKYGGHIVAAEDLIADRLPLLIDNLFKLADGVSMKEVDPKDGTVEFYVTPPDFRANQYLIDRILGKPVERTEHTGEDGGPIEVTLAARTAASIELEQWRREMTRDLPTTPPTPTPLNGPSASPIPPI